MIPLHYITGYLRSEMIKPGNLKNITKSAHTHKGQYFPGDYVLMSSIYFDTNGKMCSIADELPIQRNSLMYFIQCIKGFNNSDGSYTVRKFPRLLRTHERVRISSAGSHTNYWLKIKFSGQNYKIGGDMNLITVQEMNSDINDRSRILCAVVIKRDTATGKFPEQGNCEGNLILLRSEYYHKNRGLSKKLDEFFEGMNMVDMSEKSIYKSLFSKTTYKYPSENLSENLNSIEEINLTITSSMVIGADHGGSGARFISNKLNAENPQIKTSQTTYHIPRSQLTISSFIQEDVTGVIDTVNEVPPTILESHMESVMMGPQIVDGTRPVGQVLMTGTAGPIDETRPHILEDEFFTSEYSMGTDPVNEENVDTEFREVDAGQLTIEQLARMAREL